jgi:Tfp pilus assembly protein PilN
MRPVNLLPPEQRSGENAPLRSGPLAYVVIGALVAVLAGVTALVLVDNEIADRKSEIASLKVEDAAAKARAERLSAYTQFHLMREQRVATVTSLANSRFDWERVIRELSLVLPRDVWLVKMIGSASPEANIGGAGGPQGGSDSELRKSVPGPALQLVACAEGQEAVAGFVTALKDIDGVTRVGVESSKKSEQESGAGAAGESGDEEAASNSDECRTRNFIAKFELVVGFDAAPAPVIGSSGEEAAPATATEQAESTSTETSGEGAEG